MKYSYTLHRTTAATLLLLLLVCSAVQPHVDADVSPPQLVISQAKITSSNGQFITLYNATSHALDMTKFQLEYFNNYDYSKATSTRLINLTGTLAPHAYYMVNDSSLLLCYQLTINTATLGFSTTAGLVEVLGYTQSAVGTPATTSLQDYIAWSKTAVSGAQTLPASTRAFLERQPVDTKQNPLISMPGTGSWQGVQPDSTNACNLVTISADGKPTNTILQTGLNQLLPTVEPPATIVATEPTDILPASAPTLPSVDIGLMAPQVTELLPNPDGSGTDATDEFIELYNPNDVAFDLTGFTLVAGATATHTYRFPAGSQLAPLSFTAYYSRTTGLSLSNTSGLAKLLDPLGNTLSASDNYAVAKDGQTWALANGKWYWTTHVTANLPNIIDQPVVAVKPTSRSSSVSTPHAATQIKGAARPVAQVKGTSTTKASTRTPKVSKKALKSTAKKTATPPPATAMVTPIHPWMLALVASLAVLYVIYEYRTDLANRIYQLRRYLGARRQRRT